MKTIKDFDIDYKRRVEKRFENTNPEKAFSQRFITSEFIYCRFQII